ncbi:hypothetical protein PVMG_06032 [Plasmodium vivax Mauritania I]|uniref:Variable surface protein Vir4 n=1 Tax=Plasmodium vivax Mauritania I TaxID=1035515 RepID=A0A0J9THF6_PLAVI|nr:hypothetical protein PVMG_06032 [Plasmodium vivax Mauritania I]
MIGERDEILKELDRLSLSFSEELNSKHFYNELERLNNFSTYKEKCKPLIGTRGGKAIMNTCAKLLYYLKNKQISNKQNAQYDTCPLLNYWVYSKLNMILNSYNSTDISQTFAQIVRIWNDFIYDVLKKTKNETCEPMSNIVAYEDWKKRKELYEYYVDYSPIYESLPFFQDRCKDFYHYVESKKPLYEHFKKYCYPDKKGGCPEFYDQCEQYDPEKVLPHPYCKDVIMQESAASSPSVSQLGKVLLGNEPNSEEADDRKMTFDPPNLSGNPHTVTKFGNVLLGVVATTMTSGALYRVNINSLIQINCIHLLIYFIISP